MRYPSAVDRWLGVVLAGGPLVAIGVSALAVIDGEAPLWTLVLPVVTFVALYGLLVFPLYYELEEKTLLIRFGVIRSRVPYTKIRQVVPTNNPLSSPALSLKRLHIDAGNALGPNISPANRAGFLTELAKHCPHLRLDLAGEQLLPAQDPKR